ncbi:hypothetical protein Mal4_15380 [Maioricimonas rarisocia]|uniref:DUF1802 family protein n=2 Tax=Maioricimonas rarisocia TaxID=2528026 RepID=A0A517Z417_9PLAN|nr:hypothetical protein Mal4_15380 [Maioricimonas rarisocia]
MTSIAPASRFALKEWAAVCAALATGRQMMLLRKGGILEETGSFEVAHRQFWLYPTQFHQSADQFVDGARPLLETVAAAEPARGQLRLTHLAVVEDVYQLDDEALLPKLADWHVLAPHVLEQRFNYREPGLYALTVRVYERSSPHELAEAPEFAGCKSWVDLGTDLPADDLTPVLVEDAFSARAEQIRSRLSGNS